LYVFLFKVKKTTFSSASVCSFRFDCLCQYDSITAVNKYLEFQCIHENLASLFILGTTSNYFSLHNEFQMYAYAKRILTPENWVNWTKSKTITSSE